MVTATAEGRAPGVMRDNGGVPRDTSRTPDDDATARDDAASGSATADGAAQRPESAPADGAMHVGTAGGPSHEELVASSGAEPAPGDQSTGTEPIREEAAVESEHQVRVRRTPRYGRFMVVGGAVFALGAFIATYSLPQGEGYDRNTVFGFVLLAAVAVGVGLGAVAAIIAAAATKRTERTVLADRIDVRTTDAGSNASELPDLGELPAEAEHEQVRASGADGRPAKTDGAGDEPAAARREDDAHDGRP